MNLVTVIYVIKYISSVFLSEVKFNWKKIFFLSNLVYLFTALYFSLINRISWTIATTLGIFSFIGYIMLFTMDKNYYNEIISHFIWLIPLFLYNKNIDFNTLMVTITTVIFYKMLFFNYLYDK